MEKPVPEMRMPVLIDSSYVPQSGDIHIENTRAPDGVWVLDPQHGAHRPAPDWPPVQEGDAACTFAARLPRQEGRVCLLPQAGLDDFAAAAVLLHDCGETLLVQEEAQGVLVRPASPGARLAALAVADNAARCGDVTSKFPGVARLCATKSIPLADRVLAVSQWLATGQLDVDGAAWATGDALRALLRLPEKWGTGSCDILPDLDEVARQKREEYCSRCKVEVAMGIPVAVVESPPPEGDPSEGQGGMGLAYALADVGVAYYPLPGPRGSLRKYTIGVNSQSGIRIDWDTLITSLNGLEQTYTEEWCFSPNEVSPDRGKWGGNYQSQIVGSPRGGSLIPPPVVSALVGGLVRRRKHGGYP